MKLLPYPFENYIPRGFKDSDLRSDLIEKVDEEQQIISENIEEFNHLYDPYRCDALFLPELAYFLNIEFEASDTERDKRVKVASAVESKKLKGTWEWDAKVKIDTLLSVNSQLWKPGDSSAWYLQGGIEGDKTVVEFLLVGGESFYLVGPERFLLNETQFQADDTYIATMGYDGIDEDTGLDLAGDDDFGDTAGVVYIDVINSTFTADQIEAVKASLSDTVPSYFRVYLGYMDTGEFVPYANGQIY
jgi:hypothetical protein